MLACWFVDVLACWFVDVLTFAPGLDRFSGLHLVKLSSG